MRAAGGLSVVSGACKMMAAEELRQFSRKWKVERAFWSCGLADQNGDEAGCVLAQMESVPETL